MIIFVIDEYVDYIPKLIIFKVYKNNFKKLKNTHHNFPELKVTPSNSCFLQPTFQSPQDSLFTIMNDTDMQ